VIELTNDIMKFGYRIVFFSVTESAKICPPIVIIIYLTFLKQFVPSDHTLSYWYYNSPCCTSLESPLRPS